MIFQKVSTQESIGQNVTQLKKSEIKPTVVHAGLSVLFQPFQTEFVLLQDKLFKPEFQLKI